MYELLFPNGKRYIGISSDIKSRFYDHCKNAKKNPIFAVQHAINKYGPENVQVRTISGGSRPFIADLEIRTIEAYQTRDRRFGYNTARGGDLSPMHAPEVAAKVSKTKRERMLDPEYKRRATQPAIDASLQPEVRARILATIRTPEVGAAKSLKLKGRKASPEARANCRRAQFDPAHRERQRIKCTETWKSPRLRAEQSARHKGHIVTSEQRAKISAALMGHPGAGKGEKRPDISELMRGKIWITNDVTSRRVAKDFEIPDGWRLGKRHTKKPVVPDLYT